MEENQPKTGKFALNFGLILGALGIVFTFMLYSLDMHYQGGMFVLAVSILISLVAVVVAMLQFKKANAGHMSFGQGLKIGMGVCLVGGIIGIIFNQVMSGVIDPDMMAKATEYQRAELMETSSLTAEQIDQQMEFGKQFSTPTMQIVFGLLFVVVSGFFYSLIPALILKKQKPEY